jgi:SOS-response transcriptional repressor LexA
VTKTEYKYFSAIRDFIAKNGYTPRFHEVADAIGIRSLETVHAAVHRLEENGFLTLTKNGNINAIRAVPPDCADLVMCNRGHVPIWFRITFCPLCELLNRMRPPAAPDIHKR